MSASCLPQAPPEERIRGVGGHMRGSRKWVAIAIAIAAGSLTLWPAGAGAASIDTASDHAALVAYDSYVEGLVLSPPAAPPAGSVNGGALLAVGEEIGADLAAASYPALRAPFARFAATLVHLRWSSSQ